MKGINEKTKRDGRYKTDPVSEASSASIFRLDQTSASQPVKQQTSLSTFHENGVLGSLMICIPSLILGWANKGMRLSAHVAGMVKKHNTYRVYVRNPE